MMTSANTEIEVQTDENDRSRRNILMGCCVIFATFAAAIGSILGVSMINVTSPPSPPQLAAQCRRVLNIPGNFVCSKKLEDIVCGGSSINSIQFEHVLGCGPGCTGCTPSSNSQVPFCAPHSVNSDYYVCADRYADVLDRVAFMKAVETAPPYESPRVFECGNSWRQSRNLTELGSGENELEIEVQNPGIDCVVPFNTPLSHAICGVNLRSDSFWNAFEDATEIANILRREDEEKYKTRGWKCCNRCVGPRLVQRCRIDAVMDESLSYLLNAVYNVRHETSCNEISF